MSHCEGHDDDQPPVESEVLEAHARMLEDARRDTNLEGMFARQPLWLRSWLLDGVRRNNGHRGVDGMRAWFAHDMVPAIAARTQVELPHPLCKLFGVTASKAFRRDFSRVASEKKVDPCRSCGYNFIIYVIEPYAQQCPFFTESTETTRSVHSHDTSLGIHAADRASQCMTLNGRAIDSYWQSSMVDDDTARVRYISRAEVPMTLAEVRRGGGWGAIATTLGANIIELYARCSGAARATEALCKSDQDARWAATPSCMGSVQHVLSSFVREQHMNVEVTVRLDRHVHILDQTVFCCTNRAVALLNTLADLEQPGWTSRESINSLGGTPPRACDTGPRFCNNRPVFGLGVEVESETDMYTRAHCTRVHMQIDTPKQMSRAHGSGFYVCVHVLRSRFAHQLPDTDAYDWLLQSCKLVLRTSHDEEDLDYIVGSQSKLGTTGLVWVQHALTIKRLADKYGLGDDVRRMLCRALQLSAFGPSATDALCAPSSPETSRFRCMSRSNNWCDCGRGVKKHYECKTYYERTTYMAKLVGSPTSLLNAYNRLCIAFDPLPDDTGVENVAKRVRFGIHIPVVNALTVLQTTSYKLANINVV